MTDVDLYLNFVLNAIHGQLGAADTLLRKFDHQIRLVASALRARCPIEPKPIYRGVMLDPSKPYAHDAQYTFLSWSEDRGVARWFASARSTMSGMIAVCKPHLRGHLIELDFAPRRTLFHYSWTSVLGPIEKIALLHPFMGAEGHRQIQWSLQTQQEVITEPVDGLEPTLADELTDDELHVLERRLTPPWVAAEEGYAS